MSEPPEKLRLSCSENTVALIAHQGQKEHGQRHVCFAEEAFLRQLIDLCR